MKKLNIIYGLILFTFLVSMCSCGARKVNKEHSKEETKTKLTDNSTIEKKSETNVKTTITTKIDDKDESITTDETFEPIDPSKESFIIEKDGTKTIFNNLKKTVKKTTKKNNTATSKEILQVQNENKAVKEQKAVKQLNTSKKENSVKNVERKQFNPFELLYLIIPLLIIWFAYRKHKQLPFVPKF